jgi:hypothetical protein
MTAHLQLKDLLLCGIANFVGINADTATDNE